MTKCIQRVLFSTLLSFAGTAWAAEPPAADPETTIPDAAAAAGNGDGTSADIEQATAQTDAKLAALAAQLDSLQSMLAKCLPVTSPRSTGGLIAGARMPR